MSNGYQRNKNASVAVGALAMNAQAASPLAATDSGFYVDSNGVLHFTSAVTSPAGSPATEGAPAVLRGIIPSARCAFSAQPANNDTLTINSKTFTFKTTLIAATTTTQVLRGADAATTLASLLNAINGVTDATVVKDTTPFALSLIADAVSATVLRIRLADAQGGNAIAGTSSSYALAASITAGASAWSVANLNASGKVATTYQCSSGSVTITAAMVTNASFQIELPFTPTAFVHMCSASTGVQRAITDAVTISGNAINVALAGGASPAIQAGDLFRFFAVS